MELKVMELRDTIEMMNSEDYKERFKAEYYQLAVRYLELKAMLEKWDKGKLDFSPTCPRSTYDTQIDAMEKYLTILEARAAIENIEVQKWNRNVQKVKDLIEKLKNYEDYDVEAAFSDYEEGDKFLNIYFYKVDGITDIGHSDKVVVLSLDEGGGWK